jgi:hypothetical protein
MDDAILQRIHRIYAAIGAIEEDDPNKLKATLIQTGDIKAVVQDFRGGLSDEELSNLAHTVIHNIANLADHLRKWAKKNGKDQGKVGQTLDQCLDLRIIIDLSNNDRHGYPPRDGGRSGKLPQLVLINRVMRLTTQAQKGSRIAMTLGPGGVPRFSGNGTAKAVVTGDVVDGKGNPIGDLYDISTTALKAWEDLLAEFGLRGT